jgi:hypothetical protein
VNDERDKMGDEEEEITFGFPILNMPTTFDNEIKMKNILSSMFPNFYGMACKDLDAFLFEFDILGCAYGYTNDAHKILMFPATLKGTTLKWFMGLGESTIGYRDTMRKIFLKKYQSCFLPRDSKEDLFRMAWQENDILEDYRERFFKQFVEIKT